MSKTIIRLTESDLHRIVKESVNKILKEGYYEDMYLDDYNDDVECPSCGSNNVEPISAIDTHYRCLDCGEEFYLDSGWEPDWGAMRHESHKRNGKMLKESTPIKNKNYEFNPLTKSGIDRTMGHDMNFKYTGNDLDNFTDLLRKSDGDDFNPDWLEDYPGVEFDGDKESRSSMERVYAVLLNAGAKDVTDVLPDYNAYIEKGMTFEDIKPYLSQSGAIRLREEGYTMQWFIQVGGKEFCSKHNFKDEIEAERNCNKYIKLLDGAPYEAQVESIFPSSENQGFYEMDTMLYNEDGFWND